MGVLCWSLFWYALLYVLSSFAISLARNREPVALLLLSCCCKCHVAFPHNAVGWFAVCECGISWPTPDLSPEHSLLVFTKYDVDGIPHKILDRYTRRTQHQWR